MVNISKEAVTYAPVKQKREIKVLFAGINGSEEIMVEFILGIAISDGI